MFPFSCSVCNESVRSLFCFFEARGEQRPAISQWSRPPSNENGRRGGGEREEGQRCGLQCTGSRGRGHHARAADCSCHSAHQPLPDRRRRSAAAGERRGVRPTSGPVARRRGHCQRRGGRRGCGSGGRTLRAYERDRVAGHFFPALPPRHPPPPVPAAEATVPLSAAPLAAQSPAARRGGGEKKRRQAHASRLPPPVPAPLWFVRVQSCFARAHLSRRCSIFFTSSTEISTSRRLRQRSRAGNEGRGRQWERGKGGGRPQRVVTAAAAAADLTSASCLCALADRCVQEFENALLHPHTNSLFVDIMWSLTFEKKKFRNESMKRAKENQSVRPHRSDTRPARTLGHATLDSSHSIVSALVPVAPRAPCDMY